MTGKSIHIETAFWMEASCNKRIQGYRLIVGSHSGSKYWNSVQEMGQQMTRSERNLTLGDISTTSKAVLITSFTEADKGKNASTGQGSQREAGRT